MSWGKGKKKKLIPPTTWKEIVRTNPDLRKPANHRFAAMKLYLDVEVGLVMETHMTVDAALQACAAHHRHCNEPGRAFVVADCRSREIVEVFEPELFEPFPEGHTPKLDDPEGY